MKKRRIIGVLTILVGLTGLGGLSLMEQINSFPLTAKIIVANSIFFKGICGTLGGILIWRGNKWGYYLTLVCWLYLIIVSFLTLIQLHNNGIEISYGFIQENFSNFGRSFLMSVIKIVVGVPIIHIVINEILKAYKLAR